MTTQSPEPVVVAPREPVAWRVRRRTDDPEEWQLRPAGAALDFGNSDRWEIQPLYAAAPASPDPLLEEAVGLLTDLASWFNQPLYDGVWIIRAGDQGADDAVKAARAFLAKLGRA